MQKDFCGREMIINAFENGIFPLPKKFKTEKGQKNKNKLIKSLIKKNEQKMI